MPPPSRDHTHVCDLVSTCVCVLRRVSNSMNHNKTGCGKEISLKPCNWQMGSLEEESWSSGSKCKAFGLPVAEEVGLAHRMSDHRGVLLPNHVSGPKHPQKPLDLGMNPYRAPSFRSESSELGTGLACVIPQHATGLKDRCWDPHLAKYT